MTTFTLTFFWLMVLACLINIAHCCSEHPRSVKSVQLGADLVEFIIHLAILGWAAYLLWGR